MGCDWSGRYGRWTLDLCGTGVGVFGSVCGWCGGGVCSERLVWRVGVFVWGWFCVLGGRCVFVCVCVCVRGVCVFVWVCLCVVLCAQGKVCVVPGWCGGQGCVCLCRFVCACVGVCGGRCVWGQGGVGVGGRGGCAGVRWRAGVRVRAGGGVVGEWLRGGVASGGGGGRGECGEGG